MWQGKHTEELINDLTSEFLDYYVPGDSRQKVQDYGAYFMGSIVLAGRENAIIDGQQRFSSLALLLMYLNNRLRTLGQSYRMIEQMIFSEAYGTKSFNINVEDWSDCMNAITPAVKYRIRLRRTNLHMQGGKFYLAFSEDSYGFSMAGKIPWSHLRSIMRISDEEERNFYLKETLTENWSVRVLERNIKSGYYKRMLSTQLPDKENRALEFVKDPFVLEFMGITPNIDQLESDLETTIINNLQKFLLEMGKGFKEGNRFQTLLGVTGSGKTFTMANVIAALNKPTLVIAHNKTLAGQLYGEFKEFFPENAAEYFVS